MPSETVVPAAGDGTPIAQENTVTPFFINAKNIALSRITDPDAEVQKLKDSKVLVVCKTGQTAVQAAANLKKMGVVDVAVLKGGMAQWINEQYPVTRK